MGLRSKKKGELNRENCNWDKEQEVYACEIGEEDSDGTKKRKAQLKADVQSDGSVVIDQDRYEGNFTKEEKRQLEKKVRQDAKAKANRSRGGKAFNNHG